MNLKESCSLDQDKFDHVKSIEKEVYPPRMQTYQDFDDIEELLYYSGCNKKQIDCIVENDWYAIFCNGPTEVEITDFASRKPLGFAEILEVKNKLQSFGDKIISMNARESTSYKLIKLGERRGWFKIISDKTNITFGETMHEIIMKVIPQTSFKEWLYIIETIDANTKNLLAKQKAPQDQLDAFIKELEDEPTLINKPTAFQRFQAKFNIQKKVTAEDAQRKYFANIPNTTEEELQTYDYYKNETPQSLRQMMEQLRKFIDKKLITLKIENNIPVIYRNTTQGSNKLDTPDFGRLTTELHSIRDSLEKYSGKGNKPNPIELELNHAEHLVEKGDNIWVFKGNRPNICRILGKNQRWCISSATSAAHWFGYRITYHQTQYFVFDFNKDENDPARYVNPGVAPKGMYSEWVDAENKHAPDPNAKSDRSHVGINGYKSINEYKKYLVSKGIPLTTWTTTTPEDWEIRLNEYYQNKDFKAAKNDEHPEVFDMYLKVRNNIKDSDFETLTDEQKKESLLSKGVYVITSNQLNYAIENFKGEYYNSLDLDNKVKFAVLTKDQDRILKLAENINLTHAYMQYLLNHATDKDKVLEIIIKYKPEITDRYFSFLLESAIDKDKIIKTIINTRMDFYDEEVVRMLNDAKNTDEIAKLIIQKKPKLSFGNISILLMRVNESSIDEIAKLIIEKQTEFTDPIVWVFLFYAIDKQKIAELLQRKTDNISKLNNIQVKDLLDKSPDYNIMITIAQIINQYHKNKTPEIKELINKYL